jgi:hypothetical protein
MRILGVDFPDGAALDPAGKMPVTLYMTTDAPISVDYTMFLHLSDADDRLLFSYDGAPVEGRHPTRQWVPGVVFADTYEIGTSAPVTSGLVAWLSAGFYPFEQPDARLEARDGQGQPAGDRVLLGRVRVDSKAPTAAGGLPAEPIAMWSNGIALAAADVDRDAEGAPIGASLSWTTEAAIDADYTVFVQVLDQSDGILAQRDREPRHGRWPTSTWRAGDVITDAFVWEADVTRWQRVIIGFYDADGHRLPLTSPPDSPADALELLVRTDA